MSNAMASVVGAFANRKFSINRNTGVPRERRFSIGEPSATGEFGRCLLYRLGCLGHSTHNTCKPPVPHRMSASSWTISRANGILLTMPLCEIQSTAPRSIGSSELLTSKPVNETRPAATTIPLEHALTYTCQWL